MRAVRPVFARNSEFSRDRIDDLRQFGQSRTGVDSDPEHARSLCVREESVSGQMNFESPALNPPQSFRDGLDLLWRLFSDELQRDVQRLRPHPSRIGREAICAFEEALNSRADFTVK